MKKKHIIRAIVRGVDEGCGPLMMIGGGNDIGFGCTNCGYRAPNKYIGSDYDDMRKKKQ